MEDKDRGPLQQAVERFVAAKPLRLHVPAHRGGPGASWTSPLSGILPFDLTELPGLDDLRSPSGVLMESEAMAAQAFGAAFARYLVGGATEGILAAMLAFVRPGETVWMERSCHRSVYAGLILAGGVPAFLPERWDRQAGISLGVDLQEWEERKARSDRAALAVVTHPTYHGVGKPLREMIGLLGDTPLLVDAAHGSAAGLDERFPDNPLEAGARVAVFGLHKGAGALTQGALLTGGRREDGERIAEALRLVGTSSPSYLLLLSLEQAILGRLSGHLGQAWRQSLAAMVPFYRAGGLWQPPPPWFADPTRLTLLPRPAVTGTDLGEYLQQAGIAYEYADRGKLLLVVGPGFTESESGALRQAWEGLPLREEVTASVPSPSDPWPIRAMGPREAAFASRQWVPLSRARGRIVAEMVVPYPPGIPLLVPGERIGERELECLLLEVEGDRHVQGLAGQGLWVVAEKQGSGGRRRISQ